MQFPQIQAENSNMSVLPKNWHSWYIGGADSESRLRIAKFQPQNLFWGKFGPKRKNCPFCLKIDTRGILEEQILPPELVFRKSEPKILFGANLGRKIQSCPFCLKISTHGILEEPILHLDVVFQNSDPKIYFWTNLCRKSQSC